MRFLVTGSTGNIGVPVVKALSAAGHSVVATTRNPSSPVSQSLAALKGVVVTTLDHQVHCEDFHHWCLYESVFLFFLRKNPHCR